jgi:hypothetical protein
MHSPAKPLFITPPPITSDFAFSSPRLRASAPLWRILLHSSRGPHFGSRFSLNAAIPSAPSADCRAAR